MNAVCTRQLIMTNPKWLEWSRLGGQGINLDSFCFDLQWMSFGPVPPVTMRPTRFLISLERNTLAQQVATD